MAARVFVKAMDELLKGLLRLSRSGRAILAIEMLDMNQLVSKVIDCNEFQIRKTRVDLQMDRLPPCRGDAVQVSQIFSNFLDNALKYLYPGRAGVIRITGRVEQGRSVYCVKDNGIGIAPEFHDKIFEIFQRLDPSNGSGEGLGLA